ncbi:hypothetical protein PY793_04015 [Acetobacter fabarum]|uniref:hypothetical protein n=1 Tax=Acetobacter fabarum TaxID=483199 RepID=UPI00312BCB63
MNDACSIVSSVQNPDISKNIILYRYVKANGLNKSVDWNDSALEIKQVKDFILPEVFMREIKNGILEEYISVLYSNKEDRLPRINQCFNWLGKRRNSFPNIFGFIELDIKALLGEINSEGLIVEIKLQDADYNCLTEEEKNNYDDAVHYGIFYMPNEDTSENEIIMKLIECLRECLFVISKAKSMEGPIYEMLPKQGKFLELS